MPRYTTVEVIRANKLTPALLLFSLMLGCETIRVASDVPCPPRPMLEAFTPEELFVVPPDVQGKIARNQIKLKAYAQKLESRALCE